MTRGLVFTGREWVPIPGDPLTPEVTARPSLARPKKSPLLPAIAAGTFFALAIGIGVVALDEDQPGADQHQARATDTTSEPSTKAPSKLPKEKWNDQKKTDKAKVEKPTPTPSKPNRVVMSDMWLHDDITCSFDGYSSTVTGTITNQSGAAKSYVSVSFGLYDASGALLGSALANVNNLASGTDWKYRAIGMIAEFATCKPDDVTAY